jgi:hypothetical protein
MPPPSLLQRLKERKLVQWAVAYMAGAWVLVEAAGHVVNQFQWPPIIGQVVTIIAFFGFFVVLVIAWYHGEKGRHPPASDLWRSALDAGWWRGYSCSVYRFDAGSDGR